MPAMSKQVRPRKLPSAGERAKARRERNRTALVPGTSRFEDAYDWFRAALAYAQARTYRSKQALAAGQARRGVIIAAAAQLLQDCADQVNALVPAGFRPSPNLPAIRKAAGRAQGVEKIYAAHTWLLLAVARAQRHAERAGSDAAGRAALIKDEAAAQLIKFAEEMDADDYGE